MTCFLAFWRSFAAPSAKALTHASLCSESPLKPRRGVAELAGRFPFWPPPLPWRHATTRRTRCPPGRIGARSSHGSSCAHGREAFENFGVVSGRGDLIERYFE